ncbi:rod shape-determining protein [candidate division KSB1 bacterium]
MTNNIETSEMPAPDNSDTSEDMYIGLDLGTSQSAIATSSGILLNIPSIVGFPKDFIARKLLNKSILFGNECLRNRMSVDMLFPLEKGVIVRKRNSQEAERENEAVRELIKYLLSRVKINEDQKSYLVVGSPAQATLEDKQAIKETVKGLVDSVLIVSEPFLVAYGLGIYGFANIIDIGAGTLDICRMHGTLPDENDQITLYKAGNHIDQFLLDLLKSKIPNAHMNIDLVREIKEEYAYVDKKTRQLTYEFLVSGKPVKYDITEETREASLSILPEMLGALRKLISDFDPEFRQALMDNVILAGCGSRIKGLAETIVKDLSDLGELTVTAVDDPIYAGAVGGLKLGIDVPKDEWLQI